jgi:hypothetical protein
MSQQQTFMPNDRERVGKRKRPGKKTVVVEWRAVPGRSTIWFRDWSKFNAYATREQAEQAMRQKSGDQYFEYRIRE